MPGTGLLHRYAPLFATLAQALDLALVGIAALLAYDLRFHQLGLRLPPAYAVLTLLGVLLATLVFSAFGVYHSWRVRGFIAITARLFTAWAAVFVVLLALLALSHDSVTYSRVWLGLWAAGGGLLLVLERGVLQGSLNLLRQRGHNHKQVVVVGCGSRAQELVLRSRANPDVGFDVTAVFADPLVDGHTELAGLRIRPLDDLPRMIATTDVSEIWIALPIERSSCVTALLANLPGHTANVRYVPDLEGLLLLRHGVTELFSMPMIDLLASPMEGGNRLLKAIEDRVLAAIILMLISPLMLLIALAVKASSRGPVLFRQQRHGCSGCEIAIYKFRTMEVHTEPPGVVTQACPNDSRLTPIGGFLRRSSLDELPQFINVLQGRMSIVGPRPHAIEHNQHYRDLIRGYMLRHKVKPGITGWAQVNDHRGQTDTLDKMRLRVEFDLHYIEHWSLALDLKIILRTLAQWRVRRNAY